MKKLDGEEMGSPYDVIIDKMKEYAPGVPMRDGEVSPAFREYMKLLFTPEEAEVMQHLEIRPLPVEEIAKRIGKSEAETKEIMNQFTEEGLIHDIFGYSLFLVMPHLLNTGFKNTNANKRIGRKGAELFQQFFAEDKFYRRYESSDAGTPGSRVIPVDTSIRTNNEVVATEEVHRIIDDCGKPIVITDCPCRGRAETLGTRECRDKFPIEESCFQLGFFGEYFLRSGQGRELSIEEAHEMVDRNAKLGLIFTTDNTKDPNHQILCCCCGCCCSLLKGMTRFEDKNENCTARANYLAEIDLDLCQGCGLCQKRCVFEAVQMDDEKALVTPDKCFGCGVCAVTCPTEAIRLTRVEQSHIYENPMQLGAKIYTENREK